MTAEPTAEEEAAMDAATHALATRLVNDPDPELFTRVMADVPPEDRPLIDDALDRHAARMRARGGVGW